jgi:hypothetical protein
MKTIENKAASSNVKLEAPVRLTVDQIAAVAAGTTFSMGVTTIAGGIRFNPSSLGSLGSIGALGAAKL